MTPRRTNATEPISPSRFDSSRGLDRELSTRSRDPESKNPASHRVQFSCLGTHGETARRAPALDYIPRMTKLTWGAPERNKQPLLEVLEGVLPKSGTLLEVASGTGQHAVHFARHLPAWTIQPSDIDAANLDSIDAWRVESALPNLQKPLYLDVCSSEWDVPAPTAIFNANLIHIAPWEAAVGLLRGAARHLPSGGLLIVYGPFRIGGAHTAPSNLAFDESLRTRDPSYGVRDLEDLLAIAAEHHLTFEGRIAMPANNQTLILQRR